MNHKKSKIEGTDDDCCEPVSHSEDFGNAIVRPALLRPSCVSPHEQAGSSSSFSEQNGSMMSS